MAQLWLVRHGETEWSRTGRHTGLTDVPLTEHGEAQARSLTERLARPWARVFTSPLSRAARTAALAGLGAEPEPDLVEWAYGHAEGLTTAELSAEARWSVWDDVGLGETVEQVGERAQRVIAKVAADLDRGDVCLVGHGHALRVLGACWVGLPPRDGRLLAMSAAAVSVLGFEHDTRVVLHWNG